MNETRTNAGEAIFATENAAVEATQYLNNNMRNRGNVIALREGCRVWVRPEFASARLFRELANIQAALN